MGAVAYSLFALNIVVSFLLSLPRPFFTLVGVQLNLPILAQSIAFGILVFLCRGLCIIAGTYTGGHIAGLDQDKKKKLWMTMLAQAGVSLGLASEVAVKFPEWGGKFQTMCISVVLINQFVGPVLCKIALRGFGEAGKMTDGDDEHGEGHGAVKKLKRAVLFGIDATALSVAAKLLKAGWRVSLVDSRKEALISAKALGIPADQTNSSMDGGDDVLMEHAEPTPSELDSHHAADSSAGGSGAIFDDTVHAVWSDGRLPVGSEQVHLTDEHGNPIHVGPPEPRLDLVLAVGDGSNAGLVSSVARFSASAGGLNFSRAVDAVILGLDSDVANYELGVWLVRARRAGKVLVRTHNPLWSDNYLEQGMLPVSELAATSSVLSAAAQSRGNLQLVSATLSLQDALSELLSPVEDAAHLKLPMDGQELSEWEERNPDPTVDAFEEVATRLRAAGMANEQIEGVHLGGGGASGSRADLMSSPGRLALSMHATEGILAPSDEERQANQDMGMGIGYHAQRDEAKREQAREEKQQQEREEEERLQAALNRGQ
jgi:hypothetical protein